jgi:hypothetical protein
MKVSELIIKLQQMPQDVDVVLAVPDASEFGWELKESFLKEGDWQEGHFYSKEALAQWQEESPTNPPEVFAIDNLVVGIEVQL